MKISGINTVNVVNNYKGKVARTNNRPSAEKVGDVIEISNEGKALNIYSTAGIVSDNSSRIADIKNRIKNGTYNIDPIDTAKSMIAFMGDNEF